MTPTAPDQRPSKISRADRNRARKLLRDADGIDDLVAAVAASRGRSIILLACESDPGGISGAWIATAKADYIAYDDSASTAFRNAIICHELAHMLLGHGVEESLASIAKLIAPDIDPAVARRFFTRHGYEDRVEAAAEKLGTFMATELTRCAERLTVHHDDVSRRLR